MRIIENIITNAVKYGAPDTPITVAVSQKETEMCVNIHNHGKGIPKKDQVKLFEQFRQAKQVGKQQGYGLGLTVVKGLVEAQGGRVHIESGPHIGTTFLVALPRDARQKA